MKCKAARVAARHHASAGGRATAAAAWPTATLVDLEAAGTLLEQARVITRDTFDTADFKRGPPSARPPLSSQASRSSLTNCGSSAPATASAYLW